MSESQGPSVGLMSRLVPYFVTRVLVPFVQA